MNFLNTLHHYVEYQLPEYIQNEYPQYVAFIKAYYKFMDNPSNPNGLLLNSGTWNDIDQTLDIFTEQYRTQYAWDFPETVVVDTRRLIKYIHDYYDAKGTEDAAEMFFRIVFGEEITELYPSELVLRASDGRWSRKRFLKLDASAFGDQDPFALGGKQIRLVFLEFVPNVGEVLRQVEIACFSVVKLSEENIYLLDVDLSQDYTFPEIIPPNTDIALSMGLFDSHIYVEFGGEYYGSLSRQLVSVRRIIAAGTEFRVGDSFIIGENGLIGKYFAEEYTVDNDDYVFQEFANTAVIRVDALRNEKNSGTSASILPGEVQKIRLLTTGQRFSSRQIIGAEPYFAEDYTPNPTDYAENGEETIPVDSFVVEVPSERGGVSMELQFNTGYLYVAPGTFRDNRGAISDIVALHDNYYYQDYSYVIRSALSSEKWKPLYLRSNHPGGTKVFAETVVRGKISAKSVSVKAALTPRIFLLDEVPVNDTVTFGTTSLLSDNFLFGDTTVYYFAEDYTVDNDDYVAPTFFGGEELTIDLDYSLSVEDVISVDDTDLDVVVEESVSLVWTTVALDDPETHGSNRNRNAVAPTTPLSSGWGSYEYTGLDANWILYTFAITATNVSNLGSVCRTNVNFDHTAIRVYADVFQFGVDSGADGMVCLFVPDTSIGSYTNNDYIRAGVRRTGSGTAEWIIQSVNSSGTATTIATEGTSETFPLSTSKRVILECENDVLSLYRATATTGADEELVASVALPSAFTSITSRRVGLYGPRANLSGGYTFRRMAIQNLLPE